MNLQENENLKKCLLKCKNNKSDRNELRQVIEKEIFLNRKLMDEEFEYLLKYLSAHSQDVYKRQNFIRLCRWNKS